MPIYYLYIICYFQFYEAEVTGVSANTVVVKFCAYGNHEEVLKSNCLPFPNQGERLDFYECVYS